MSPTKVIATDPQEAVNASRKPWSAPTAIVIDVPGVTHGFPNPMDEGPTNSTSGL